MKILLLSILLLASSLSFAQNKLPFIRATSENALIIEGDNDRYGWTINPAAKPDIHTISKITNPRWIRFYTDIDSIKIKIRPGQKFDFIVLLNNKDSCFTQIESRSFYNYSNQKRISHDTIPFVLTEFNNLKIKAIVNGKDTLDLKFDSGTNGLLLTEEAIKNKAHSVNTAVPVNSLQIGRLTWDQLPVYPVKLSGQGTDGRFGWDLFDGRIVEIDYDKNIFIIHSNLPKPGKAWSKFTIEYVQNLLCIQGTLQIGTKKYTNRFLFDNGYQRTVMLDTLLMQEQNYPQNLPVIKKVIMKNGRGDEIPIITVNNERLNFGRYSLYNIPVQLLTTGNPARFKTHIAGNEVLKRFNTILDFQNNVIYLLPNKLIGLPYTDAK